MASGTSNVDGASKDAESAPPFRQLRGHRSGVQQPFDAELREGLINIDRQSRRVALDGVDERPEVPVRRVGPHDIVLLLGLVGCVVGGRLLPPLSVRFLDAIAPRLRPRGPLLPLSRPRLRRRLQRRRHGR